MKSMDSIDEAKKKIEHLKEELAYKDRLLQAKEEELQGQKREVLAINKRMEDLIFQVSREFDLALKLQRKLSPVELPHLTGFEFSSKFNYGSKAGGDYFDVFELPEKMKFVVLLSSCSGYAVSALLISTLLKNSATRSKSSGFTAIGHMDQLMGEMKIDMTSQDRCSLVYALFDRRNFEMELVGCGHIAVIIQRTGKDKTEVLNLIAQPFAKDSNFKLNSQKLSLQPKDRVVFVSSGVLKEPNSQGQEFGLDRLVEIVRKSYKSNVHELRNEILFQLEKFSQQKEAQYDQTVIVSEVKDRVIKLAKADLP